MQCTYQPQPLNKLLFGQVTHPFTAKQFGKGQLAKLLTTTHVPDLFPAKQWSQAKLLHTVCQQKLGMPL